VISWREVLTRTRCRVPRPSSSRSRAGASVPQTHRRVLPLYSLMIATEPLSDETWEEIRSEHGQTFSPTLRHLLVYGQRTADKLACLRGRGARYPLGAESAPEQRSVCRRCSTAWRAPSETSSPPPVMWGSPTAGVAHSACRDWHASAFDAATGIATAGGYVGRRAQHHQSAGRTPHGPHPAAGYSDFAAAVGESPFAPVGAWSRCVSSGRTQTTAMNIADAEERVDRSRVDCRLG
jgi:hypothetical protein